MQAKILKLGILDIYIVVSWERDVGSYCSYSSSIYPFFFLFYISCIKNFAVTCRTFKIYIHMDNELLYCRDGNQLITLFLPLLFLSFPILHIEILCNSFI